MQDIGDLGGPQVAGRGGCGLAAGLDCHGASLSCGGPRQRAPDPEWIGCSSPTDDDGPRHRRSRCRAWCWNEQDDYRDQTKHPTIARLGRFSSQLRTTVIVSTVWRVVAWKDLNLRPHRESKCPRSGPRCGLSCGLNGSRVTLWPSCSPGGPVSPRGVSKGGGR
jgi:hypothetical protein